ncbi:MAG: radical SAM protein [bacterium]
MSEISEKVFQRDDIHCSHSLQSNLLLYNKEVGDLIKNVFNKTISSSLDFPNIHRKLNNKEDYETKWLEKYYEATNDGIKVNVISLLNSESIKVNPLDFYNYYIEKGIKIFQVNLPHASGMDKNKAENFKLDIELTKGFFSSLMEIWLSKKDTDDSVINPFNYFISVKTNRLKDTGCIWSYECINNFISVSPTGDISLCDCFNANYSEYIFGNILKDNLSDILNSQNRKRIINRILKIVEGDCGKCRYLFLCHGGCPIRSLSLNGDINEKDYYCDVYKKIFEISLNYMMLQSKKIK